MAVDTNKRPVLWENLVYYNEKDKAWTLGKSDSALQASDVTTGGTEDADGTISVKGAAVAVKGYSALASDVADLKAISEAAVTAADIDALFAEVSEG